MILLPILAMSHADWPHYRVNEAQVSFQMPAKPTYKKSLFHNTPTGFYTADAPEGRFVVAYTPFAPQIRDMMHKKITGDPGGDAVRSLLSMNLNEFAKAGGAKVVSPKFGLNKGLPAAFAVLDSGKTQFQIRVYLGSVATYLFVTSSSDDAQKFFDSIKLPAEIQ